MYYSPEGFDDKLDEWRQELYEALIGARQELKYFRAVTIENIELYRQARLAQLNRSFQFILKIENLGQKLLALVSDELDRIISFAEVSRLCSCPHCGKKFLLKKDTTKTRMKCPYLGCRRGIKITRGVL